MRTSFFLLAAAPLLLLTGCSDAIARGFSEQAGEVPVSYGAVVDAGTSTDVSPKTAIDLLPAPGTHQVGGSAFGLGSGETLVLEDNGGDDLTFVADSKFTFPIGVVEGHDYAVTVKTQPAHQQCVVRSSHGTMGSADVTDVSVECGAVTFALGGVVSNLTGTLVLHDPNGGDVTLTQGGSFYFPTSLPIASDYDVTIAAQPDGQQCVVSRGTGIGFVANEAVTSVVVGCTDFPNASFDSGFTGWTLTRDAAVSSYGGAAIVVPGTTLALHGSIHEVISDADVTLGSDYDALPMTITAPSNSAQVGLLCAANGPLHLTATRDLALSSAVTGLSFELQYASGSPTDDDNQYVHVQLLDPTTNDVLTTLSSIGTTSDETSPPTTVTGDVSAYAGRTVRLQLEIYAGTGPLFVGFDSFTLH